MAKTDRQIMCVRCEQPRHFAGTYHFREDKDLFDLLRGSGGGLLNKKLAFDLYACKCCGSVELFVDGVGEHLRHDAQGR